MTEEVEEGFWRPNLRWYKPSTFSMVRYNSAFRKKRREAVLTDIFRVRYAGLLSSGVDRVCECVISALFPFH